MLRITSSGTPRCLSVRHINLWLIEGKAALKSNRTRAPLSDLTLAVCVA